MKYLIFVNPGLYDRKTGKLSMDGKKSMIILAKAMIDGGYSNNAIILTSPPGIHRESSAVRCSESSLILADYLGGVKIVESNYLGGLGFGVEQEYELICEYEWSFETMILVPHADVLRDFPVYFLKKRSEERFYPEEIKVGEALVLDLESGQIIYLPQ